MCCILCGHSWGSLPSTFSRPFDGLSRRWAQVATCRGNACFGRPRKNQTNKQTNKQTKRARASFACARFVCLLTGLWTRLYNLGHERERARAELVRLVVDHVVLHRRRDARAEEAAQVLRRAVQRPIMLYCCLLHVACCPLHVAHCPLHSARRPSHVVRIRPGGSSSTGMRHVSRRSAGNGPQGTRVLTAAGRARSRRKGTREYSDSPQEEEAADGEELRVGELAAGDAVQLLAYDSQLQRTHAPSDYRAPLQQAPMQRCNMHRCNMQ